MRAAVGLNASVADLVGEVGGVRSDAGLFDNLAVPGAIQLLDAFVAIKRPAIRTAVINLVRSFVEEVEPGLQRGR